MQWVLPTFKVLSDRGTVARTCGRPKNPGKQPRSVRPPSVQGSPEKSGRRLDEDMGVMNKNSEKGVWTRRPIMKRITKGLQEVYVLADEDKNLAVLAPSSRFVAVERRVTLTSGTKMQRKRLSSLAAIFSRTRVFGQS
ncbi:hypothetical protein BGZ65_005717 [Modicella reniformis]|uniref:Uncharacterized protein n=1 Tax=Modicella reniformis TaxID=1440133 RepID=A0A9P6MB72_9FUNG|nr:hypothetical protein BGZ65_005717 [Modicella reniformis]